MSNNSIHPLKRQKSNTINRKNGNNRNNGIMNANNKKIGNNNKMNTNNGQMIFISDLEGCARSGPNKKNQSIISCSKEFFDLLDDFLASSPMNKVSFLGDYFDKGPDYGFTIERIIELYEKYNSESNIKVYIILGNRDINKLRLKYECDIDFIKQIKDNSFVSLSLSDYLNQSLLFWSSWKDFYIKYYTILNKLNTNQNTNQKTTMKNIFKLILDKSMGAIQKEEDYETLFKYFNDQFNLGASKNNKNNVVMSNTKNNAVMSNNKNNAVMSNNKNNENTTNKTFNLMKLYEYGKIVDYDPDYKVLLSHAGGMDNFFFHNQDYYDDIKNKIRPLINGDKIDYFSAIELARRELMKKPKLEHLVGNSELNINNILEIINSPLESYINSLSNNSVNPPLEDYYLLQALGLKADGAPGENHFVSFVESCDCTGCKGPGIIGVNKQYNSTYNDYLKKLEKLGITFVASGHRPHCAPVPLIYKRLFNEIISNERPSNEIISNERPSNGIIFIANDVSNGYRPAKLNNKVPLSFIRLNNNNKTVGVTLFDSSNPNSNPNSNIPEPLQDFKAMINEWKLNKVPVFDNVTDKIKYENNVSLTFPARTGNPFSPALMITNRKTNRKTNGKTNGNI